MHRWGFVLLAVLGGACRGEAVLQPIADSGAADVEAAVDSTAEDVAGDDSGADSADATTADSADSMVTDSTGTDSMVTDSTPDSALVDSTSVDDGVADAALVPFVSAGNDVACGATRGGRMAAVLVAPAFCIDEREVTAAEYVQFLEASDKPIEKDFCDWNKGEFGSPLTIVADSKPITWVDWCDAYAYCEWAGKRLCGNRAAPGPSSSDLWAVSQWTVACMNGDSLTSWSVGSTEPGAGVCNIAGASAAPGAVGTRALCHGIKDPYDRVFDMCGNVEEWDMSGCNGLKAGSTALERETIQCGRRGGHFGNDLASGACRVGASAPIDSKSTVLGFRCCKSPVP